MPNINNQLTIVFIIIKLLPQMFVLIRLSVHCISFSKDQIEYAYIYIFIIISQSLSGHNRFFKPAHTGAEQHVPLSWLLIWNKAYPKTLCQNRIGIALVILAGMVKPLQMFGIHHKDAHWCQNNRDLKRWSFSLEEMSFRSDSGVNVPKCIPHMLIRFKYIH